MTTIPQSQYSVLERDQHRIARQSRQFELLSHQLGTGKRYQHLYEYGTEVSRIIDLEAEIERRESYLRAIRLVEFNVEAYQDVLAELEELTGQARKLAREAPPTLTDESALKTWRTNMEVTSELLLLQLTEVLNTEIGGRYIFSGDNFDSPATIDLRELLTFSADDVANPNIDQQQTLHNLPHGAVRFEAADTPQTTIQVFQDGVLVDVEVDQGGEVQTQQITVHVSGDITPEQAAERFKLELGEVTPRDEDQVASTVIEDSSLVSVLDDDPVITIRNVGVTEVIEGGSLVFAVQRHGGQTPTDAAPISVDIDSALPLPAGYSLSTTTVTFNTANPDEVLVTLQPEASFDAALFDDERISLQLANPSGARLDPSQSSAAVKINDTSDLSIEYMSITADTPTGAESVTERVFTIRRENPGVQNENKTVSWRIDDENSTMDPVDFGGSYPSGQVTFNAGETEKKITVHLSDDGRLEGEERFQVLISGDAVVQPRAESVVTDNEASYGIVALDSTKQEGSNEGHVFLVTRQGDTSSSGAVDVGFDGVNVVGVDADANTGDGLSFAAGGTSTTVNFAAGETEKLITVFSAPDTEVEGNETFQLSLSNPTGSSDNRVDLNAFSAQGMIVGDDFAEMTNTIAISLNSVTPVSGTNENGPGVQTAIVFDVTRTQATVDTPAEGVEAPEMEEEFVTFRVVDNQHDPASSDTYDFVQGYGLVPSFAATNEDGVTTEQTYLFGKIVGERDPGFWKQQKASVRDGENRTYGITAADPTFQKLIKTLVLLKSIPEERNVDGIVDMLGVAERMSREVITEIRHMASENAIDINGFDAVKKSHEMFKIFAQGKLEGITDVDTAEAAAYLSGLQTQVNASYTLISKRAQLSLANFL